MPKVCTWAGSQRSAGTQVQLDTGGPGVITPAAALVPREVDAVVRAVEVSAVVDVVVVLVVVVVVEVVVDSAEVVVLLLLLVVVKG